MYYVRIYGKKLKTKIILRRYRYYKPFFEAAGQTNGWMHGMDMYLITGKILRNVHTCPISYMENLAYTSYNGAY